MMPTKLALLILLPIGCDLGAQALGLPFPGSIAGFLALLVMLACKGGPSDELAGLAGALVRWLPLMFVAPMVGILVDSTLLVREWLPIAAGVTAGVVASLFVTGIATQSLLRRLDRRVARENVDRIEIARRELDTVPSAPTNAPADDRDPSHGVSAGTGRRDRPASPLPHGVAGSTVRP